MPPPRLYLLRLGLQSQGQSQSRSRSQATLLKTTSTQQRLARWCCCRRSYSSDAASGPLIRVTNLPAANTGHIRVLELNRPGARNAISKALLASLRAEVEDVQAQYTSDGQELPAPPPRFGGAAGVDQKGPTRALIVASAVDASFCAGADLKERRGFTPEE